MQPEIPLEVCAKILEVFCDHGKLCGHLFYSDFIGRFKDFRNHLLSTMAAALVLNRMADRFADSPPISFGTYKPHKG